MLYGQNGLPIETGYGLGHNLGRPCKDQARLYLAQTETGEMRGKVGYVG